MDGLIVVRNAPTLRELALEKMRGAILSSRFKAGERLVERKLCEQLGVSRTIVREVLRHLEAEGLITMQPHQGPVVTVLDPSAAGQIYEIRGALESMAARSLALRADRAAAVQELNEAISMIEAALRDGEVNRALDSTARFYEVLFTRSNMDVAWAIIRNLNARINSLRSLTLSVQARTRTGPEDMRGIVRAIGDGNGEAAEKACKLHVQHAYEILRERLKQLASQSGDSDHQAG